MLKQFKKTTSDDKTVTQVQENIEQAITPIISKQIIDGILLRDIVLTTGSTDSVNHKLGRKAIGYLVTKQNANSSIWNGTLNSTIIELNCSANVTVDLWVF